MSTTIPGNPTTRLAPRSKSYLVPRGIFRFADETLTDDEVEALKARWKRMLALPFDRAEGWPRRSTAVTSNGSRVEILHMRPSEEVPDIEIDCVHWDEVVEELEEESVAEWLAGKWQPGDFHPWEPAKPFAHHPREQTGVDIPEVRGASVPRPAEEQDAFVYDIPEKCVVPPPGWRCSREAGHDGPCAARPTAAISAQAKRMTEAFRDTDNKRCSVNLALRIRGACKRNDLRVGQLLANAMGPQNPTDPYFLTDEALSDYIDKIEDGRKAREIVNLPDGPGF